MKFKSENDMSEQFKKFLISNLVDENIEFIEQFSGLFGIPDYLLIEKNIKKITTIITIELKLNNWKRALKQAFKYKSFSNVSFVIIDEESSKRAIENIDEFIHFNIGLASFNTENELKIYFDPIHSEPFSQFFLQKIRTKLDAEIDMRPKAQNHELRNRLSSFVAVEEIVETKKRFA